MLTGSPEWYARGSLLARELGPLELAGRDAGRPLSAGETLSGAGVGPANCTASPDLPLLRALLRRCQASTTDAQPFLWVGSICLGSQELCTASRPLCSGAPVYDGIWCSL